VVRRLSHPHPNALHSGTRVTRAIFGGRRDSRSSMPLSHLRRLAQSVNPSRSTAASRLGCSWRRGAHRFGGPAATRSGTTSAKARRLVNPNGSVVKAWGRCEAKVPFAGRAAVDFGQTSQPTRDQHTSACAPGSSLPELVPEFRNELPGTITPGMSPPRPHEQPIAARVGRALGFTTCAVSPNSFRNPRDESRNAPGKPKSGSRLGLRQPVSASARSARSAVDLKT